LSLFVRVLFYPILVILDLPERLQNWFSIKIRRAENKYKISGDIKHSKNVAIFAVFPGTTTWFSFHRAASTLIEQNYELICIVNTNKYSDKWIKEMHRSGFTTIERQNIGADFGAYKLGIRVMNKLQMFQGLENLILINDSIYFTDESLDSLKEISKSGSEFNCLYLHKQSVPHAGSMLIRFDQDILQTTDFIKFWKKYYSYSNKKKIILKGEHQLSKACGVGYFRPYISTKNSKLKPSLKLKTVDILQVLTWAGRSTRSAVQYLEKSLDFGDHGRIIEYVIFNFQVSNSLGLFFSRELRAPLKMDLVSSGLINCSDFCQVLIDDGCSSQEILEAQELIYRRGSYFSRTTLERIRNS